MLIVDHGQYLHSIASTVASNTMGNDIVLIALLMLSNTLCVQHACNCTCEPQVAADDDTS